MNLQKNNIFLLVFLFLLLMNGILFSGHSGGDAIWNYLTAESIFMDGNLDLADSYRSKEIAEFGDAFSSINIQIKDLSDIHGEVYSKFGLGSILIGALFYGLGLLVVNIFTFLPREYVLLFIFSLQNVFITALLGLVFFRLAILFISARKTTFIVTLSMIFSTIIVTYAVKSGFGEPLAALIILSGAYFLVRYDQGHKPIHLFFAGLFTGMCILTKMYTVLVFPAFFIFCILLTYERNLRNFFSKLLLFAGGFIIPFFVFCIYNYIRFENILETGYSAQGDEGTISKETVGSLYYGFITLINILFSPGKGLLIFNPVIILSLFGLRNLYNNNKKLLVFIVFTVVPYVLFFSFSSHWASFGAWGTRYFVPLIPVLLIPSFFLLEGASDSGGNRVKKWFYAALMLGVFIQLPSVLMNYSAFERFLKQESPHSYYTRINLPQYSQLFGGYYQLLSGVKRLLTGESLDFPVIVADTDDIETNLSTGNSGSVYYKRGIIVRKPLTGYDWFDLWYLHLISSQNTGILMKVLSVLILLFMIISTALIYKRITLIISEP